MAKLIEFQDVWCEYAGRPVLRGIELTVNQGETLVLLGRSGSGKTTLLRTANRLIEPSRGAVRFEGSLVRALDVHALRRRIGYVIQEGGLFPHFTVEENIGLVPTLEGWPAHEIRARVEELLEAMRLPPAQYIDRYPRSLSGGERQRVGIARALAANPPLLLLDEPFAALDPLTRFALQRLFLDLRHSFRTTAIFVTHDVREALMVASRIALLRDGQLDLVSDPAGFAAAGSEEARRFLETVSP
ncbi:MAG: ATP-binding cassette domain-containing protein [Bryobacteraceae bacterium]|nr:ATP-binding cassette domain-containing protein [Bryobacteraceae bacterium]